MFANRMLLKNVSIGNFRTEAFLQKESDRSILTEEFLQKNSNLKLLERLNLKISITHKRKAAHRCTWFGVIRNQKCNSRSRLLFDGAQAMLQVDSMQTFGDGVRTRMTTASSL